MSRLLVTNKSFELLEPYEGKLSRTVLRGESSRKGADLLDSIYCFCFMSIVIYFSMQRYNAFS